jgi:3-mercaptopyruvate sulfurtransferase SseA
VATDAEWQARAKGILKGELKRRGVSYRVLAEKLAALGVKETEQNIANKISRGGFSAVFLFQCLEAIGCKNLAIGLE